MLRRRKPAKGGRSQVIFARWRKESGASMVELALVLPLLLIVLFGIMEASWAFAQQNDVRHGAREGARAAAVNVGDADAVAAVVCDSMDFFNASSGIQVRLVPITADGSTGGLAEIEVEADISSLTGFFPALFGGDVASLVEFRTEQPSSGNPAWWGDTAWKSCP